MARVEVDIEQDEDEPIPASERMGATFAQDEGEDEEPRQTRAGGKRRPRSSDVDVEIEREITKRQIVSSVSSVLVVILYMIFTLLRDRDAGVVVIDNEGPEDDWAE